MRIIFKTVMFDRNDFKRATFKGFNLYIYYNNNEYDVIEERDLFQFITSPQPTDKQNVIYELNGLLGIVGT